MLQIVNKYNLNIIIGLIVVVYMSYIYKDNILVSKIYNINLSKKESLMINYIKPKFTLMLRYELYILNRSCKPYIENNSIQVKFFDKKSKKYRRLERNRWRKYNNNYNMYKKKLQTKNCEISLRLIDQILALSVITRGFIKYFYNVIWPNSPHYL